MKNVLSLRLAAFLKNHQPFSALSVEALSAITSAIRVVSLERNETLFKINDVLHADFYVVFSGVVNLSVMADAEETMLSKCIPGDVFGLRPFFAKNNYMMTAKAREDAVICAIPIDVFRPYVAQNTEVLNYLLEIFASNTIHAPNQEMQGNLVPDHLIMPKQPQFQYFQPLSYNKKPIKVSTAHLIQDVASMMTDQLSDSAIVIQNQFPIGIITDGDLRSKIATGRFLPTIAADRVMSSPVVTVSENISLAEAQLLMLKNNITHLCVTADGSEKSQVIGVISQNDLIVAQASNPGVLVREIKRATTAEALKTVHERLLDLVRTSMARNIPLPHIGNIAHEITTAMIKRAVELSILAMGSPPARFAWLAIGELARKEQLLNTRADGIIVFQDVTPENVDLVRAYFMRMARRSISMLQQAGFSPGFESHAPVLPFSCRSLAEWTAQYAQWVAKPGARGEAVLPEFLDLDLIVGESSFEEALLSVVYNAEKPRSLFDYLGNDTLRKPPPLTFFKKFVLEEEGPNRDKFHIGLRAIEPFVDAARLFSLRFQLRGVTHTFQRFRQLAVTDARHAEVYLNAADSWVLLSKFAINEGMKYEHDGKFLNLEELSKLDREKIKTALEPLKDLETLIKDKFRLTQFS